MIFSKLSTSLLFIFLLNFGFSQITSGKITYERKTNLLKKFKDDRMKRWINESNKIMIDHFELYFNDTFSVFVPVDDPAKSGMMAMATNKNSVIQHLKNKTRISILSVWGEKAYVKDSLINRQWKITENKRKISGYQCRKAIFRLNDSTRIYAWFSEEVVPSIGPETFQGLPGAILGLATEDGGVVYFAKKVEPVALSEFTKIMPEISKKTYSHNELKNKLEKDFGDKPWGKGIVDDLFMW